MGELRGEMEGSFPRRGLFRAASDDWQVLRLADLFPPGSSSKEAPAANGAGAPRHPEGARPPILGGTGAAGGASTVPPQIRATVQRLSAQYESARQKLKGGDLAGYAAVMKQVEQTLDALQRQAAGK